MKKLLTYLLPLLLLGMLLAALSSCGEAPAPQELSTPGGLTLSKSVLTWGAVDHAALYRVSLGDEGYETAECRFDLSELPTAPGVYSVEVQAIGDGIAYADSPAATVSYTVPAGTEAEDEDAPTPGLRYTLLEDGSGYEVSRWTDDQNLGLHGRVVIPDTYRGLPVKRIAEQAFSANDNIGITDGGYWNTVTTSFRLPSHLESIGDGAFSFCRMLEEITIPDSVTEIGERAFCCCTRLRSIALPSSLTEVSAYMLKQTALTSLRLPGSVVSIDLEAFVSCTKLTDIVLPEDLTTIGAYAFQYCDKLAEIVFTEGLTTIGVNAFQYCTNLTEIVIPASVTEIGQYAFQHCTGLSEITLSGIPRSIEAGVFDDTAWYAAQSDGFVRFNGIILYRYKGDMPEGTVIDAFPDGVRYIAAQAFYNCRSLVSVTLPEGLIPLGGGIFQKCSSLVSVNIPTSFEEIPASFFEGCTSLKSFEIPAHITRIGNSAFRGCSSLEEIGIPASVTCIGGGAFLSCSSLESIEIPAGVTCIDSSVFGGCASLKTVSIPEGVTRIGSFAFANCKALRSIILPSTVREIGASAFTGSGLEQISLPQGITTVEDRVFNSCASLGAIILPDTLSSIAASAFRTCTALSAFYFCGTEEQWNRVTRLPDEYSSEDCFAVANTYFYSETEPPLTADGTAYEGDFWHYAPDGVTPTVWEKES